MDRAPVNVRVAGLWRGVDLAGDARLGFDRHHATLGTRRGVVTIPYTALDGVRVHDERAELYLHTGDVIVLSATPALADTIAELSHRACALPEMTRSLRGLGSRRAAPGAEHDRFFEPFLEAKRAAEQALDPADALAAFDAGALRALVARRLGEFAAERYPDDPPERRALEAELLELAEGLDASFDALARSALVERESGESERFAAWRAWAGVVARLFERADECWLSMREVLVDSRRAMPGRRRRRHA